MTLRGGATTSSDIAPSVNLRGASAPPLLGSRPPTHVFAGSCVTVPQANGALDTVANGWNGVLPCDEPHVAARRGSSGGARLSKSAGGSTQWDRCKHFPDVWHGSSRWGRRADRDGDGVRRRCRPGRRIRRPDDRQRFRRVHARDDLAAQPVRRADPRQRRGRRGQHRVAHDRHPAVQRQRHGCAPAPRTGSSPTRPPSGTTGTQTLTFAYCTPGNTYPSAGNCTTATITYAVVRRGVPGRQRRQHHRPSSRTCRPPISLPATAVQGSTVTASIAPVPTSVPATRRRHHGQQRVAVLGRHARCPRASPTFPAPSRTTGGDATTSGHVTRHLLHRAGGQCVHGPDRQWQLQDRLSRTSRRS